MESRSSFLYGDGCVISMEITTRARLILLTEAHGPWAVHGVMGLDLLLFQLAATGSGARCTFKGASLRRCSACHMS